MLRPKGNAAPHSAFDRTAGGCYKFLSMNEIKTCPEGMVCLINPKAANSKWMRRKRLRRHLEETLQGEIIGPSGDSSTTVAMTREACRRSRIVVATGGDGTIADVLQGIFESGRAAETVLGIIPFGSGNAFRKSFGIPKNTFKALSILSEGIPRPVDVMQVENKYAGFASVGATAAITIDKIRKKIPGFWGHVLAIGRLISFPRDEKTIDLYDGVDPDGRPFAHKTVTSNFFDCIVAKTNYFGYSWKAAPKARLDDGLLDITLIETGVFKYGLAFPFIFLGWFQKTQRNFKARKVVIRGKGLPVQYNGEILGRRDAVTFEVRPAALKVLCPDTPEGRKYFCRLPDAEPNRP